jgi:hypothetical protein
MRLIKDLIAAERPAGMTFRVLLKKMFLRLISWVFFHWTAPGWQPLQPEASAREDTQASEDASARERVAKIPSLTRRVVMFPIYLFNSALSD